MKKEAIIKKWPTEDPEIAVLRHWKYMKTKTKLAWLEAALRFGKLRKF